MSFFKLNMSNDEINEWIIFEKNKNKENTDFIKETNLLFENEEFLKNNDIPNEYKVKNLPKDFPKNPKPIDFFSLYFSNEIWEIIVNSTNNNINNEKELNLKELSCEKTNIKEIKKLNGIFLWFGIHSCAEKKDYWSNHFLFQTEIPSIISFHRFHFLKNIFVLIQIKKMIMIN